MAREWYWKGVAVEHIAERLGRHRSRVWDKIGAEEQDETRGVGRKASLSEEDKDELVALTKSMVKKANVRYTVTAEMIRAKFNPKVCLRVLRNALHERNIWFRKLRRKPILTDDDVKERYKWARTFRNKSRSWWRSHIQVHIDNHAVKVPTNGKARDLLAARHGVLTVCASL